MGDLWHVLRGRGDGVRIGLVAVLLTDGTMRKLRRVLDHRRTPRRLDLGRRTTPHAWPSGVHDSLAGAALLLAVALFSASALAAISRSDPPTQAPGRILKPVSAFADINNDRRRSVALFEEMGKVIQSPRCLNCHPRTDRPTQGDAMTPHLPIVTRGVGGLGAAAMHCTVCHRAANFDPAGVPGNPRWSLAPVEFAWQGKTLGQICRQVKDQKRNGGRDLPALIRHMGQDDLVGWAWRPGRGRTAAPGTQAEFGALVQAWADSGAHCPVGR